MISWSNLYHVVEAMVPLYAAMALGYASAKANAFSAEQCAGINHFVAIFAIPMLTFRIISSNDPYAMNLRFLAADILQKLIALAGFAAWARLAKKENALAWAVTLFSLVTLPNTIIMGVPVLGGMYGAVSESLMAQTVVLQFALWYVLRSRPILNLPIPPTAGLINLGLPHAGSSSSCSCSSTWRRRAPWPRAKRSCPSCRRMPKRSATRRPRRKPKGGRRR